jgi:hypothetical protein
MIEIYILAAALVAAGGYINFLTWKLGRMATHLENQGVIIMAMMEDMEGKDDGNKL